MPRWRLGSLSPERKMDVLGVVLIFTGLISILSLVSPTHGALTNWWVNALYIFAGWGAFILPVALIIVGLWLVFRKVERLPVISTERLVGITLVFLNILTWIHLFTGTGLEITAAKPGGGYLGALPESGLVYIIGKGGAAVVLVGWLLIGLALAFDISIQDLFKHGQPVVDRIRQVLNKPITSHPACVQQPAPTHSTQGELPNGFQPLASQPVSRTVPDSASGAVKPASGQPSTKAPVKDASSITAAAPAKPANVPAWKLPAIDEILDPSIPEAIQSNLDYDRARVIENTLTSFGVPVHVVEIHRGPTITQFGVEPDFIETRAGRTRVRVSKIVSLSDDLALALAAPRIRIQAPVPGRNYVGIEVPNVEISRVTLREVLESDVFIKMRSALRFSLGKDVAGKVVACDLAAMPHLLIAGTTGSGKSVCVNGILCSLLMNNTPLDLRLVLVDPKRVELTGYNGIPHLMAPVVVEAERVISALQWMMREMDNRYHKFAKAGVRNIQEYNLRTPADHLPYLVVVVDELADLMMQAPDETERTITRLAQLARATGIHLILATQRPSVNVVTGLIKANFPARVAFMVAAMVDSRVILDQPGAEWLLGRGDMLFQAPDAPSPVRLQGAFVSDSETQRLVEYWRSAASALGGAPHVTGGGTIDALPSGVPLKQEPLWDDMELGATSGDPLLSDAIDLVRREGRASITMLQRKMRIGYTRAARMIDVMEDKGIIGPPLSNTQVREVLDYGPTAPPKEE